MPSGVQVTRVSLGADEVRVRAAILVGSTVSSWLIV